MRAVEAISLVASTGKRVNKMSLGAKNCPHVICARALWPNKTAENWAAAAGRKPSIGKVWLNGEISGDGKLAIVRLLV